MITGNGDSLVVDTVIKDTLYFNAYTEDLFHWEYDFEGDSERFLHLNSDSQFFNGFKELAIEPRIKSYLNRYCEIDFEIQYETWRIIYSKEDQTHIKVSRGEENIFIWCIFLAICELVIDGDESYSWVKYIYIDDPISSLDENNAIAVASDLAQLLKRGNGDVKTIISSHHSLFYNIMCNEMKSTYQYFLYKGEESDSYSLRKTDDTPFFHHVAMLSEIKKAVDSGELYTYHFNMMRSILEKTSSFFGYKEFSDCIKGIEDEVLYSRAVNLLSHGKYSLYEPRVMMEDTKDLLRRVLDEFLNRYEFQLPKILADDKKETVKNDNDR